MWVVWGLGVLWLLVVLLLLLMLLLVEGPPAGRLLETGGRLPLRGEAALNVDGEATAFASIWTTF